MARSRCLALLVLAVGAAQAKRVLLDDASSTSGTTDIISSATQSFAAPIKAADQGVSAQIDNARDAAMAAVPKQLDTSASDAMATALNTVVPQDFSDKVAAAMKNFKADDKTVDPKVREYAKMLAGVMMLNNDGDSNIANTKLGELVRHLIKFTFDLVKLYVTAPAKIITDLPSNLTTALAHSQPQNFLAWFQDHEQVYKDLLGIVYKPDGQNTATLSHPDSVDISSNFINYAPCIVSVTPTGFQFAASFLTVIPSVLQAAPEGGNIQPQIANIQPALIYIFPAGFNVQPQGINVAPTLIGITPGGYSNTAIGGLVGGSLIGVSVEQPDS